MEDKYRIILNIMDKHDCNPIDLAEEIYKLEQLLIKKSK